MAVKTRKKEAEEPKKTRVGSKVSAVTIYTDRAMVTRVAYASLDVGEVTLVVEGLPAALDEYSFRVSGKGPARVRILGVKLGREFTGQPSATEAQRVTAEMEKAEDDIRALNDQRHIQADRAKKLQALAEAAVGDLSKTLARKRVGVNDADAILTYFYDNLTKTHIQLAKTDRALREKKKTLDKIKFIYQKTQSPRPLEQKTATITLECTAGGEFGLALSYVMPGSGWEPAYDIRYDEAEKKTEITYRAAVFQNTGEDWEKVNLRLSTSRPAAGAAPPALAPRYLDFIAPMPPARPAAAPEPAKAKYAEDAIMHEECKQGFSGAADIEIEIAENAQAIIEAGVSLTYAVAGLPSVPADGEPHIITVGAHRFAGEFAYVITPETAAAAYLRVKGVNDAQLTFLPGVANIFRGDDYVGRATLPHTVPGAEFEYYLGTDDRVKVKYERRDVTDEAAGLSGATRRISYQTVTDVENNVGAAVTVELKQLLPTSRNKDIKVKVSDTKPKPQEKDADGVLTWTLDLKTAEKKTVAFAYDVEFPRGRMITGV